MSHPYLRSTAVLLDTNHMQTVSCKILQKKAQQTNNDQRLKQSYSNLHMVHTLLRKLVPQTHRMQTKFASIQVRQNWISNQCL